MKALRVLGVSFLLVLLSYSFSYACGPCKACAVKAEGESHKHSKLMFREGIDVSELIFREGIDAEELMFREGVDVSELMFREGVDIAEL